MWPTIFCAGLVALVFIAIVARGIHNKKRHKGGCGCGCDSCPGRDLCHPQAQKKP